MSRETITINVDGDALATLRRLAAAESTATGKRITHGALIGRAVDAHVAALLDAPHDYGAQRCLPLVVCPPIGRAVEVDAQAVEVEVERWRRVLLAMLARGAAAGLCLDHVVSDLAAQESGCMDALAAVIASTPWHGPRPESQVSRRRSP